MIASRSPASGDATIDRLMRAEGELARGVHLQARIRGSAIEFSGSDGVVLGAPFSATGRMPLAWAVPAWLADARLRGDISPIEATVSARSDARLAPALQALGIKNTEHVGDRDDRYRSPRGRAATRRCRGHGHHRGCRGLGRRFRPDPAGTDQAAIRSRAAGSRRHSTGRDLARSSRPRARSAFCQAPKESFGPKGARPWRFSG